MARYLQTQALFRRAPSKQDVLLGIENAQERCWAPAVLDLDCVQTCNPSWVFDSYDETSAGCPERNCTEVLLKDGTDFSINLPFAEFAAYLTGEKPCK